MREDEKALLRQWRNNPLRFVWECIEGAYPTPQQIEGLEAAAAPGAHLAVRAGHGVGKTSWLSWLIYWFSLTNYDVRIPCTAPTSPQLYDILWAELNKWHARLREPFRSSVEVRQDKVVVVGLEKINFAIARTARRENPEALQGFHAKNLMYVVDEASGVDQKIFEVAEGALSTKDARVVLTGNPTRRSGYFYDAFHKDKAMWTGLHWSSLDSPLVDADFPARMERKYGKNSNVYRVRVLGDFPTQDADQFIPSEWVEDAYLNAELLGMGLRIWGLDPSDGGDCETALAKRWGDRIHEVKAVIGKETMQVVGWVVDEYENTPRHERPDFIFVDSIGIGAGVYSRLRELKYPAISVNVARSPSDKKKFISLRDELYKRMRDWFESRRGYLVRDAETVDQIESLKFDYSSNGKLVIMSKKQMKKDHHVEMMDRCEAVMLTFFEKNPLVKRSKGDRPTKTNSEYDEYGGR